MITLNRPKLALQPQFGASLKRKVHEDKTTAESYDDIVLVSGARTPFAKIGGSLRDVTAFDLLRIALKGAMDKSKDGKDGGIKPEHVSQLIIGNIIANKSQSSFVPPNLRTALGLPVGAQAVKVDRLCGTGFEAIRQAAQQLTDGGDSVILTGGVENMSRTPVMDDQRMLVEGFLEMQRKKGGLKGKAISVAGKVQQTYKNATGFNNPLNEGLTDPHADIMIGTGDLLAKQKGITRKETDAFAARSQERAALAQALGLFDDEIVAVRKNDLTKTGSWKSKLSGKTDAVFRDEHIRPGTTADKLAKLEVIRKNAEDAIHTAGSSSGLVDGAAAIAVSTGAFAKDKNLPVLAKLKSVAVSGCDPKIMGFGPARAIPAALEAAGLTVDDVDLFEVNEAFAGQAMAVQRAVGIPDEKFNVDGGAIAIGHPLSASGSRIALHAAHRLKKDGKRFAVVSACIGGGQGIAAVIENPNAAPPAEKK